MKDYFDSTSQKLFRKSELQFIGWFAAIFLGTLAFLAVFGLLPSELQEQTTSYNFIDSAQQSLASFFGVSNDNGDTQDGPDSVTAADQANGQAGASAGAGTGEDTSGQGSIHSILAGSAGVAADQDGNQGGQQAGSNSQSSGSGSVSATAGYQYPEHISIPSIGLDSDIENPVTTNIDKLDDELAKGPVHYPGSGTVGVGNMYIFGHSTGFPVVINKAYKVFNDLHTLSAGDLIYVQSGDSSYEYKVRDVHKVDKNDTLIQFDTNTTMLTLSTCDSFGAKTDRYVVQADYVGMK